LYQVGLKLGVDKLSEYYGYCGFGKPTGIDLPGEAAGLYPDSKYYDNRYGRKGWTQGLVLNNAIGQGELLVTPLHLIQFYCALANRGTANKLHMVKKTTGPDGSQMVVTPSVALTLPFSKQTLDVLLEGLRLVVEGEHGTAKSLLNDQYSIGGKTGTAQNPHGENHSWFVGVAPLESPEIVVCALVENAGHGSEVAAPVAAQVIKAYMDKRNRQEDMAVANRGEGN
jgi:penicillin-binding protein 2